MKDTFRLCRKCGKPIAVIKQRLYRNIIVDAEAVAVKADKLGMTYLRFDGSKILARPVKPDEEVDGIEYVYRQHRWSCGRCDDL